MDSSAAEKMVATGQALETARTMVAALVSGASEVIELEDLEYEQARDLAVLVIMLAQAEAAHAQALAAFLNTRGIKKSGSVSRASRRLHALLKLEY